MRTTAILAVSLVMLLPQSGLAAKRAADKAKPAEAKKQDAMSSETFSGLEFRLIGPALTEGRICDFAVDPADPSRYYVAVCSGGVWKTETDGTTFAPIFDKKGSYSIGCITMDPTNPHTLWVGAGENNAQRSVSWGNGVYVSRDDGSSWENVGLKDSQHIGRILVDPRDSNVVYVAAQGPLWGPGGDRGLYKTTDGGKTWSKVLGISENTGVNEVVADPRNPDVLYASAWQRRRRVWTLIDGGPESALYKSTDAGKSWRKVDKGLPKVDMGRIGLAVSPADPDVLYAIVEAAEDKGGVFRSTNRGESWEKRSDYMSTSGQYYNELFCDPKDVDTVYSMDTFLHVSVDGGKTFERVGEDSKHVDNHAMWIDPHDTDHFIVGCDGGIYESFNRGKDWLYLANLPITQFYRVEVDNSEPFYYVYGGTQDNNTLGGPSRTKNINGIMNSDWFIVTGGDGFVARIDPTDPNIVYAESQYAGLVRFDRKSGEEIDIQPQEAAGEAPNRWNWDSPLIISPYSHTRLYFASQRVYRSNDRGDTWTAISGDLTRQIDRNKLEVMGRIWPVDAVSKSNSTSFYGNIVSLSESPLVEGLIYAGTDDGLIQVTEDGGKTWRKIDKFPGLPELVYVSGITASRFDADTVYACFDNHKNADFAPYALKSTDRGRTWTSISGDLPEGRVAYTLKEDSKEKSLLFLGTEFGVYFTVEGGNRWIELKGGLPTIAVRDLAAQEREGDLALATFGRSFYVLDDYTPLRGLTREKLSQDAILFPVRDALAYNQASPIGGRDRGSQGDNFFIASNPPFGAVFTYYLKDEIRTLTEKRREAEREAIKKSEAPPYPTVEELRAEKLEAKPTVVLTVTDADDNVVDHVEGPVTKGFHRVAWNLRYPPADPPRAKTGRLLPWESRATGPAVVPGEFKVSLAKQVDGVTTELAGPVEFKVAPINLNTLAEKDRAAVEAFEQQVARLQRAALGARDLVRDLDSRLDLIEKALVNTSAHTAELRQKAQKLRVALDDVSLKLSGDSVKAEHNIPAEPSIVGRVQRIVYGLWGTTAAPTQTQKDSYGVAAKEFTTTLAKLKNIVDVDFKALNDRMNELGSPWTPGRFPEWKPE